MKQTILGFLVVLALFAGGPPASADSFAVFGSVQNGFWGPAVGATVTICEYGPPGGFVETIVVPEGGFVSVLIPYLPLAVAFEVENDPVYQDVHVLVARPDCWVSPCVGDQSASFEVRLQRRPALPGPIERRRSLEIAK
jgi:hypothetical protein